MLGVWELGGRNSRIRFPSSTQPLDAILLRAGLLLRCNTRVHNLSIYIYSLFRNKTAYTATPDANSFALIHYIFIYPSLRDTTIRIYEYTHCDTVPHQYHANRGKCGGAICGGLASTLKFTLSRLCHRPTSTPPWF